MRKPAERVCKECGKFHPELSRNKLCPDCAIARQKRSVLQLRQREGEVFEKWLQNIMAGVEKLKQGEKGG